VVLRGLDYHAAHYQPVALTAAITAVGYRILLIVSPYPRGTPWSRISLRPLRRGGARGLLPLLDLLDRHAEYDVRQRVSSRRPRSHKTMIGFCTSPRFVEHLTGPHHPERPDRIRAIARAVREAGMINSPDPFPDFRIDLGPLPPAPGKLIELAPIADAAQYLPLVHTPRHIQLVERVCRAGGGVLDLGDTPVGAASYDIALLSLGGVLACCDAVMAGRVRRAFAAGRPPGHHAEPNRPMGFCLFSNVAIAARYLQKQHGIERMAIVDFDVHHGNGTQAAFESDPSVLFISLHQNPRTCYPRQRLRLGARQRAGRRLHPQSPLRSRHGRCRLPPHLRVPRPARP